MMLSFHVPMSSTSVYDKLRLFLAQGKPLSKFREEIKQYDFSLKCNAVWSSDAIAYRCNTCAYNPCMSLCLECFQNANHEGHDFNRFFSQAGGACDCGNSEVLRESGFCSRHGRNAKRPPVPSANVVSLAEFVIPKLFVRLFLHFRGWVYIMLSFLKLPILDLVDYGGPLRDAVARTLLDSEIYEALTSRTSGEDLIDFSLDWRSRKELEDDAKNFCSVHGFPHTDIGFSNMLDELVFYLVRLLFPQSLINLCLSMLSDIDYRNHFASRFFFLYPRIAEMMVDLAKTERNSVIYAVSILSSEAMCLKLDDDIGLVHIIVVSTEGLLSVDKATFYSSVASLRFREAGPKWQVYSLDNNKPLRKHAYWTLVSDMQNLLAHPSVARRFLRSVATLESYASIISRMQEFSLASKQFILLQLSFHLEWEVSAKNMFNALYALTDEVDCMVDWLISIGMGDDDLSTPPYVITYHLALHRHLAAGIECCLRQQAFRHLLSSILLNDEQFLRKISLHPMRIQVCRAETAAGMWARNGNAARNMSFYYAQTNYNTAFLDFIDLISNFYRFIATSCDPVWFFDALAASFFLDECLKGNLTRKEWCVSLIEGFNKLFLVGLRSLLIVFLNRRLIIELIAIRWNVGGEELESIEKEIVAALAISDLTHSKLRGSIPEQGNRSNAIDDHMDELLSKVCLQCLLVLLFDALKVFYVFHC
ncbi:unnamed protein product [Enterobius vermicularis]|uniref:E3 ubiquitin-protein ligase n=1 Tax=Enterobius vermicularis TaxID=51028 RepID=A0A158QB07_ENTVE|nr:unnamed protein product [Enterobius vermicularis]